MRVEEWGTFEGEPVHRVALRGGGLTAHVITWGAVVQDLRLDGVAHPLVLGFDAFAPYPERSPFFGAVAGRVANRIGHGRFEIDGQRFQARTNPGSEHTLHGGPGGMGKRLWRIEEHGADFVELAITDPDGFNGFPGTLEARCRYTLTADSALAVELSASTSAPTPVNLAHHTYWNLDGSADVRDHTLQVAADRYSAVDDDFIPTGETPSVAGTRFDMREPVRLGNATAQGVVDHNLVLADRRRESRPVARLAAGGLALAIETTEPGLQVYAGHKIQPMEGLDGRTYGAHAGIALEPQVWPDAVNHSHFPEMVLRPGETYRQVSRFRVELTAP